MVINFLLEFSLHTWIKGFLEYSLGVVDPGSYTTLKLKPPSLERCLATLVGRFRCVELYRAHSGWWSVTVTTSDSVP